MRPVTRCGAAGVELSASKQQSHVVLGMKPLELLVPFPKRTELESTWPGGSNPALESQIQPGKVPADLENPILKRISEMLLNLSKNERTGHFSSFCVGGYL